MYIQSIHIRNLKSFTELNWALDADTPPQGWHVILGPNGSGKSSFIQALAITLIGLPQANAARLDTARWISSGQENASIILNISWNKEYDVWVRNSTSNRDKSLFVKLKIEHSGFSIIEKKVLAPLIFSLWGGSESNGWFSAGFGPFRRFTGGNADLHKLYSSHPKLARHLSVFGEDVALTEALTWLRDLRFKQLESQGQNNLLDRIKNFINQEGFLPFGAKLLEVNSEQIVFHDGAGVDVSMLELSDGYRSVLSMTFELIRLMAACFPNHELFDETGTKIIVPGVVLIDEVDVHLHPNWQRDIGPWLCRLFPQVQFIVTTHSPFVCQQATSVWKLPDPGSDEDFKQVQGEELTKLLYGDATLALETPAFGLESNRSDRANALLDELAALNRKATQGRLDEAGIARRMELQNLLRPVLPEEV